MMLRNYLGLDIMLIVYLLVCCFGVVVVRADESTPLGDVDESSDLQTEESDGYDDEPVDHSAFLQIDDSPDLHVPKQTKRIRKKIRAFLKEMDSNTDGIVDGKELSEWIEKVMTDHLISEGKKQMHKIDKNEDGLASWPEYALAAGYSTPGDEPEPKDDSDKSKKRDKKKFDLADTNKDGKLSYYELGVMIHPNEASQMSSVVVKEFLEVMDKDGDGQLSLEEYIGEDPSLPVLDKETKEEFNNVFKALDVDQDGRLNNEELADWLLPGDKPIHQSEAEELMKEIDEDKDGDLTAEEIFKSYMKFATSRATRYGRMLKDELPDEDDDVLEKQHEKRKEEKKDNPDEMKTKKDEKQHEKVKEGKEENEEDEKKNGKHKPDDEL